LIIELAARTTATTHLYMFNLPLMNG